MEKGKEIKSQPCPTPQNAQGQAEATHQEKSGHEVVSIVINTTNYSIEIEID